MLILDDVDTDLDRARQHALLAAATQEAQTLASTTERDLGREFSPLRVVVTAGRIEPAS